MKINIEKIKMGNKLKERFCIITDIHHIKSCDEMYYAKILESVSSLNPNYILIPGDIVDDPKIIYADCLNFLIAFLKKCANIAPVIISKGNHELKDDDIDIRQLYKKLANINNLYVLDNQNLILGKFNFIGFSPRADVYLNHPETKVLEFAKEYNFCKFNVNNKKINILLCHSPLTIVKALDKLDNYEYINYIICGHMHNGLVPKRVEKLFKTKGFVGPEYVLFPPYCRGVHSILNTKVIICKSLRVLTKDKMLFRLLDKLYARNITIIDF